MFIDAYQQLWKNRKNSMSNNALRFEDSDELKIQLDEKDSKI